MSIEEIKERKQEFEKVILEGIRQFENDTNTRVSNVSSEHDYSGGLVTVKSITIKVEL